jgi:hypothetical protein
MESDSWQRAIQLFFVISVSAAETWSMDASGGATTTAMIHGRRRMVDEAG